MRQTEFLQYELPCATPGRQDDWFIPDRAPLAPEDERDIRQAVWADDHGEPEEYVQRQADKAVANKVAELKSRRRKAVQSCRHDCPMAARLLCLDEGLKPINLEFGIRGGYGESERREIATAISKRKKGMSTGIAARIIVRAEKEEALDAESDQD